MRFLKLNGVAGKQRRREEHAAGDRWSAEDDLERRAIAVDELHATGKALAQSMLAALELRADPEVMIGAERSGPIPVKDGLRGHPVEHQPADLGALPLEMPVI